MRVLMLATTLMIGLGGAPARVQDAEAGAAIQGIISQQIDAFRADDFKTAFSFASPMIKQLFATPERFGEMVRNGYPMVWRPAQVRFSDLAERGGRTIQSALVTDENGVLHIVDYEMIAAEGGWQINGVMVRRAGDAGA